MQTHVCFVDLVKAYDTADHKLIVKVLEKYGAPPKFCLAVERMNTDLKVVLKTDCDDVFAGSLYSLYYQALPYTLYSVLVRI
jgi:hypothetical protein